MKKLLSTIFFMIIVVCCIAQITLYAFKVKTPSWKTDKATAIHLWELASQIDARYKIPCFAKPVMDAQIKLIIWDKMKVAPQYDSIYVTLCPPRATNQQYSVSHPDTDSVTNSVTNNPVLIVMRFFGQRQRNTQIPHILYDPHGDSLQYLNPVWYHEKLPLDYKYDSIMYANRLQQAQEWLAATTPKE